MGLDKTNKNYFYNLGRAMAVVEIINGLQPSYRSLVYDNAKEKFPYQLREALRKTEHNLQKELLEPAEVVLTQGELPIRMLTPDEGGKYWIGFYHEKAYLRDEYKGIFGTEEIVREEYTPKEVSPVKSNDIEELKI